MVDLCNNQDVFFSHHTYSSRTRARARMGPKDLKHENETKGDELKAKHSKSPITHIPLYFYLRSTLYF